MKSFVCLGLVALLATQLHAETYSWIDDSGTYNFTEDYSRIPKKYRKKVKRREDVQQDEKPPAASASEKKAVGPAEKPDAKASISPDSGKEQLYGGKSRAAWSREMAEREAELTGIEQRMEQIKKQISDTKGVTPGQFEELKKEYNNSRATYDQKYKGYSDLMETIRKAGIPVEIKK